MQQLDFVLQYLKLDLRLSRILQSTPFFEEVGTKVERVNEHKLGHFGQLLLFFCLHLGYLCSSPLGYILAKVIAVRISG